MPAHLGFRLFAHRDPLSIYEENFALPQVLDGRRAPYATRAVSYFRILDDECELLPANLLLHQNLAIFG